MYRNSSIHERKVKHSIATFLLNENYHVILEEHFHVVVPKMNIFCEDDFECIKNHETRKISFGRNIERYEPQVNTSALYKTFNLPERFENTHVFRGFGIQRKNVCPFYRTTNLDYGWYLPSPHTVPQRYFPRTNQFSELMAKCGMYRNHSLNTIMD